MSSCELGVGHGWGGSTPSVWATGLPSCMSSQNCQAGRWSHQFVSRRGQKAPAEPPPRQVTNQLQLSPLPSRPSPKGPYGSASCMQLSVPLAPVEGPQLAGLGERSVFK